MRLTDQIRVIGPTPPTCPPGRHRPPRPTVHAGQATYDKKLVDIADVFPPEHYWSRRPFRHAARREWMTVLTVALGLASMVILPLLVISLVPSGLAGAGPHRMVRTGHHRGGGTDQPAVRIRQGRQVPGCLGRQHRARSGQLPQGSRPGRAALLPERAGGWHIHDGVLLCAPQ